MNQTQLAINRTTSTLTGANRWDHVLARWGINRMGHIIEPGLYSLGNPRPQSPVFVTANYTLSFDALRSAMAGVDGYILALDTEGINVWCAAGKGTFGTDELVKRVETANLKDVVSHRTLILPQLGAPGVAAHAVKQRTGFKVEYGPVRASDLPEYLKTHQASQEMRQVTFSIVDRLVLIPVELVGGLLWIIGFGLLSFFTGGISSLVMILSAILAGIVLFPILLPWLPARDFSAKGFILGGFVAIPFAIAAVINYPAGVADWQPWLKAFTRFLTLVPIVAFLALNFTGSTPYTSRTGVRREMFKYIPAMAIAFGSGIVLNLVRSFIPTGGMK